MLIVQHTSASQCSEEEKEILFNLLEKKKCEVSGQFVKSDNIIFSLASPALARRRQRDFLRAHGLDGKSLGHDLQAIAKK